MFSVQPQDERIPDPHPCHAIHTSTLSLYRPSVSRRTHQSSLSSSHPIPMFTLSPFKGRVFLLSKCVFICQLFRSKGLVSFAECIDVVEFSLLWRWLVGCFMSCSSCSLTRCARSHPVLAAVNRLQTPQMAHTRMCATLWCYWRLGVWPRWRSCDPCWHLRRFYDIARPCPCYQW